MRAILLCAGRGSRLLPLTLEHPKCLVPVGGKAILDHQMDSFRAAGIGDFSIVGGYRAGEIAQHLEKMGEEGRPELILNPFWSVTSSIASLWIARERIEAPFAIANGDTIFAREIIERGLERAAPGINLLVERSEGHLDDMRVEVRDGRIAAVGKTLDPAVALHRSLGVIVCRTGGDGYRAMLDAIIAEDGGPGLFHHEVIHRLAQVERVTPIEVGGGWTEIDSPGDIEAWRSSQG